ncbi:MAG: AraC family transcriptional regulator [Paenibacillaceae bacterium]|nr:AraC family transcriptional regulator [Paenibacillaceae bacterium]
MKAIRSWFGKKYLMHILLSLTLLTVLVLVISSFSIYLRSKSTILQIQEGANLKVLQQIDYNVQYMNQIVMQSATSSFFDPDSVFLMNMKTLKYPDVAPRLDRLNNWINSAPFLESIIVYNPYLDLYISTRYTGDFHNDSMDGALSAYLRQVGDTPPRSGLIALQRENAAERSGQVFTYLIFGPLQGAGGRSVMAFNIRAEWLLENLQNIRLLDHDATRNLVIADQDGIVLQSNQDNQADEKQLMGAVGSLEEGKLTYIQEDSHGEKQIVTVLSSRNRNWHLASYQDYNAVYESTNKLWVWYMTLLGVFILMTLVISALVSRFLYRPVASIMADLSVSSPGGRSGGSRDEFGAIRDHYKDAVQHLQQLRQAYDSRTNSMQSYYLRKWFMDSASMTGEEMALIFPAQDRDDLLPERGLYRVCILRIDRFRFFEEAFSAADQKLIKFAVCNIAEEMLGKHYSCSVVYMQADQFAVVALVGSGEGNREKDAQEAEETRITADLCDALAAIQQSIDSYYHVSLTASVDDMSMPAGQLTTAYFRAQDMAQFRFRYGFKSLITAKMTKAGRISEMDRELLPSWDRRMEEALKTGRADHIRMLLKEMEELLSGLAYNEIIQALFTVVSGIMRAIQDINRNGILQVALDNKQWYDMILESETLFEALQILENALMDIIHSRKQEKTGHAHALLTEAVKEIVDEHLADLNLGAVLAADMLRVQASHLKKVFRETTGLPLHEYIHRERLAKAKALLEATDYTVNDITEKVGYANQSYFFQMFKKQFGATPKEYRQKMLLERKEGEASGESRAAD